MKKHIRSFHSRLFLFFTISIIIPVISMSIILSLIFSLQIHKENQRNIKNTANAVAQNIDFQIKELNEILYIPYLYTDILNTMRYFRLGFFQTPPSYLDLVENEKVYAVTFSKIMLTSTQFIAQVGFYPLSEESEHYYVVSRSQANVQIESDPAYKQQAWFLEAQTTNDRIITYNHDDPLFGGQPSISVLQMIRDFDSKKGLGVMRVDVSAQSVIDSLSTITLEQNAQVALIEQDGQILFHMGNGQQDEIAKIPFEQREHKDFLITRIDLPESKWSLVYLSSKNNLRLAQLTILLVAVTLSALIVITAAALFRQESQKTAAHVNSILSTLKKIQAGDFSAQAEVFSSYELNQIAIAVNDMGKTIEHHIEQEYQAVISRQKAEYLALQTQINPHFLYNLLSDFIALNRMGWHQVLEESIFGLTKMLRYTCMSSDLTTVGEELTFCQQYLLLRKLQMQERLTFAIDINEQVSHWTIPKLLIQPIIENSIQHGSGMTKDPLHIFVQAEIRPIDGALLLRMEDDGIGFKTDEPKEKPDRVGIENVKQRLLIFHKAATFFIDSKPGKGTCCKIIIPQEMRKEDKL